MIYIGNTGPLINWDAIIDELSSREPEHTGPDNSLEVPDGIVGLSEIRAAWDSVGVKPLKEGGTNNWDMYLPGYNFSATAVEQFSNFVNADVISAWISNIHPGCMAHWHWDTSGKELVFDSMPNLVRYCGFITDPQPGHVFMAEGTAFAYRSKGEVWKWPDRKMWHGGVNFGLGEKYMFHYIGTSR